MTANMGSIHIPDVSPKTLRSLKRLARSHHRSLQGELRAILESAARMAPAEAQQRLKLVTVRVGGRATWSRDEIYGSDVR